LERRCRTAKSQYLNRVITYMRDHLQENLTLTRIAREAGLSESYLNAVFKECVKCAPMDYYINMKMEQACYLLCNTDMHIYQVAQYLGYDNQYYFSRAFKKVLGVPPKKYKEMPRIPSAPMQVSC
jgi:AraC-like DNA-binding protein